MFESLKGMDRHQWNAAAAAFLGWSLDAFDFFLMVFMFPAIAKEFHAPVAAVVAASTVTLAARPFGALFFGVLADRLGRRPVLVAVVIAYSALEFASAFAPGLAVLIILRALFGFAMGGEWGVGASLALESIPPKARGVVSGFLQEGYAVGYLLAALVFFLLFDRLGWRAMFMVGVIPALLAAFISIHVKESPAFEAQRKIAPPKVGAWVWFLGLGAMLVALAPALLSLARPGHLLLFIYAIQVPIALAGIIAFRRFWKLAIYLAVLMTGFNLFSHGTQDLYPTFLIRQHHLGTGQVSLLTIIGNFGAIAGGVTFGAWSQRLGRRRAIIVAALLSLAVVPLWALSHTVVLLGLGAFLMQMMVQGAWGVVPAHLNELSPTVSRGAFPGFVYQLGNLLASGLIIVQTRAAEARGGSYGVALAVAAVIVALLIAVLALVGPERREADLTSEVETPA
jgi:SHS family lactate transporter-like MFS transporter